MWELRNSGKSRNCACILNQAKKDKTYNEIFIITPSFCSNKKYWEKHIPEENVYEPTKDSIALVIARVEVLRDEWEEYLQKLEEYKIFRKEMRHRSIASFAPHELMYYLEMGFMDGSPPEWKYPTIEPPKCLLILDDVLNSPAILQSSGLTKIGTLNRHIAPLKEEYKGRSACGLSCIMLSQTYSCQQGISRVLRENLSILILFPTKSEPQLAKIREELCSVVDLELFDKAFAYATAKKYGTLTIDFAPKKPEYQFRKNLNEFIIFDDKKEIIKK